MMNQDLVDILKINGRKPSSAKQNFKKAEKGVCRRAKAPTPATEAQAPAQEAPAAPKAHLSFAKSRQL